MAVRQLYLTLLALTSLLLAACSSVPAQPVGTAAAMQAGEGGMIVVVVDNPAEAGVAPPGSTPQGYDGSVSYSVSSSARNAIATLAQKYDLRNVFCIGHVARNPIRRCQNAPVMLSKQLRETCCYRQSCDAGGHLFTL